MKTRHLYWLNKKEDDDDYIEPYNELEDVRREKDLWNYE